MLHGSVLFIFAFDRRQSQRLRRFATKYKFDVKGVSGTPSCNNMYKTLEKIAYCIFKIGIRIPKCFVIVDVRVKKLNVLYEYHV